MPFYKNRKSEGGLRKERQESDRSSVIGEARKIQKVVRAQNFCSRKKKGNPTGKKGRVRPLFLSRHDGRFDSSFLETITVTQERRERRGKLIYI